jgi:hypothetical protein
MAKRSSSAAGTSTGAMVGIERDNPKLKGVLPKEYAKPFAEKMARRSATLRDQIAEGQRLDAAIEATMAGLVEGVWKRRAPSRALAALRDALLPKLIFGEARVGDAERFLAG